MRIAHLTCAVALALASTTLAQPDYDGPPGMPGNRFEEFARIVRGAKEHDGFLKLYQKDDKVFAEIQPHQFDRPMLCPIAIAKGIGMGGTTLNFDEQWVLMFKRYGDKVHLVRRNVRHTASGGGPTARAVETTYTDSVLMSLRVAAVNPQRQAVLINLNDIFMTDFAGLHMGMFDSSRSVWHKIKAFPGNIELEVAATYTGSPHDDSVIDRRGSTVVMHYGLCPLPESGYSPRLADDRVGHFLSVTKDFSNGSSDTAFVRYVNRWRLERADPVDPKNPEKLSDPKKKIVYWIEKSVPTEYRASVRAGILEWNKAFEKVGFRDAIEVRQQESEEFDPEDIHYNTFRWIATDRGFAMGPSRANPLTGEIIDADIIFDASMVRLWQQEHNLYKQAAPASLMEATRQGWTLQGVLPASSDDEPKGWNEARQVERERPSLAGRMGVCQCGSQLQMEMGLGMLALAGKLPAKSGDKATDELLRQAVKYVTMHEVGHTLGLRHNFKASTMLKADELHNTAITRERGLVGSVMDYVPVNLAPAGVKQGDYFPTTLGPYDYWAIEYAYKPDADLKEIAKRSAGAGLDYGTDEDMRGADPHVHVWDLGADPLKFAIDRANLSDELMKGLADRVVDKGEGYQRARQAFRVLLGQYANAAYLASGFVGGEFTNRDHRDDPDARDPLVPVSGDKQREALKFLREKVLTDGPFTFSPKLLRQMAGDHWNHWGNDGDEEFRPADAVLNVQKVVLRNLLSGTTLSRVQSASLKVEADANPLNVAEVFRCLHDGIWCDLGKKCDSTATRRNLQREYVKDLATLALGKRANAPPDARSLARAHLKELKAGLTTALNDKKGTLDATTRAHYDEIRDRAGKVLDASVTAME